MINFLFTVEAKNESRLLLRDTNLSLMRGETCGANKKPISLHYFIIFCLYFCCRINLISEENDLRGGETKGSGTEQGTQKRQKWFRVICLLANIVLEMAKI